MLVAGIAYLAWALACWSAKQTALLLHDVAPATAPPPLAVSFIGTFHAWPRMLFDLLGPVWMLASLYMVIRASRQRRIISWSWLLASSQAIAAVLIAAWAQLAQWRVCFPASDRQAPLADPSPIVIALAVVIWVATLIWLVGEGFRLGGLRGGPAIGDSAKTHSYRR